MASTQLDKATNHQEKANVVDDLVTGLLGPRGVAFAKISSSLALDFLHLVHLEFFREIKRQERNLIRGKDIDRSSRVKS
jgi:hypothetical protein